EARRLGSSVRRPGEGVVGHHRPGRAGADHSGLRDAGAGRGRRVQDERLGRRGRDPRDVRGRGQAVGPAEAVVVRDARVGCGCAGQRAGDGDDQPGAGRRWEDEPDLLRGRRDRRPGRVRRSADDH
ncbi:MAG: Carbon monoxide oxidation accessory protein CoxG, partial [uncultured Gemmatimonadetes bacterium]